jgi:hypothetical protein
MIPEEKAKELINKLMPFVYVDKSMGEYFNAINCALIAVNMILKENLELPDTPESTERYSYWYDVKIEIETLL